MRSIIQDKDENISCKFKIPRGKAKPYINAITLKKQSGFININAYIPIIQ